MNALQGVVGLACLVTGAALAQPEARSALLELERAGRAIAAQPCKRPLEQKSSQVGATGDEMHAVDCGSFRIASYVARSTTGLQRALPMALVVLGPGPELPAGITLGMSADEVAQRLGPPSRQKANSLSYLLDPVRPDGDLISFEIEGGLVRAVSWSWRVEDQ